MMIMREFVYRFCRETNQEPPVDLVDFAEWLDRVNGDASEMLEKHAAKILNESFPINDK